MIVRPVNNEDLKTVIDFHSRRSSHELDFSPNSTLFHGVCEKNGEIIAYGAVKKFHEMVISLNYASKKEQKEAIDELFKACLHLATLEGTTNLYAFTDPAFAEILKGHYGFSEIDRKILGIKVGG